MKWFYKILGFAALGIISVGCSSSGDITDITQRAQRPTNAQVAGLTVGSQQNVSVSGYTVSASVGEWAQGPLLTESQGYKVYSSVQGAVLAESTDETIIVQ